MPLNMKEAATLRGMGGHEGRTWISDADPNAQPVSTTSPSSITSAEAASARRKGQQLVAKGVVNDKESFPAVSPRR
jgi:hypothetical protein